MNSQIKTMSILGWTLALSEDIKNINPAKTDVTDNDKLTTIKEAAAQVSKSSKKAIKTYPALKANNKTIKIIKDKICQLDGFGYVRGGEKRLEILLAILLVAYDDITSYVKDPKRRAVLLDIIESVMVLSELIDPDGDQTALYIRAEHSYSRWLKEK